MSITTSSRSVKVNVSSINVYGARFCELDSHADTCVIGKNALVINDYEKTVNVTGYDESLGTMNDRRIVSAAVAYDRPDNGQTIMLIINQAIEIETMNNNLLNPMQMRMNGVKVNEQPKFLTHDPTETCHTIQVEDDGEIISIPLDLKGIISCFETRKPTLAEFENCPTKIHLTASEPEWNPHSEEWSELEGTYYDSLGRFRDLGDKRRIYAINAPKQNPLHRANIIAQSVSQCSAVLSEISNTLVEDEFYDTLKDTVNISVSTTSNRSSTIRPQDLMKRWGIGLETAKQTLNVTTQRGIRTVANPAISRRFRTNDRQLRYRRLNADLFTDTLKAKTKSFRGNEYAQAYGTPFKWARFHPIQKRDQAHHTLGILFARDGYPPNIICDNAMEQVGGVFRRKCTETGIHMKTTEPHTPWSNAAESTIREGKRASLRMMFQRKVPKRFWDDAIELQGYIMSHTAHPIWELQGQTPETVMTGSTADISQFCDLEFYEWVFFFDGTTGFPDDKEVLGRSLGPALDVGPAMCMKFLKENGEVVHRSTYRRLTEDEMNDPTLKEQMNRFDESISRRHGAGITYEDVDELGIRDALTPELEAYDDNDNGGIDNAPDDEGDASTYDQYINAHVMLPRDGENVYGKVSSRKRTSEGHMIGRAHAHPILDTRVYNVKFPDGEEVAYAANVIAENMYAQCDTEGNHFLLLDEIIDHKKNGHAVSHGDQFITVKGKRVRRKTTVGWHLCVKWKDGSTTWERLADLKESNPVEVAEYALSAGIDDQPAFNWWVPFTLKKRDRIIAAVAHRTKKRKFKFGFEVPASVADAMRIDKENGNTLWMDALRKEMKDVRVAFKFIEDREAKIPPGYQQIGGHIIWDVKMENFRRKARYVAEGNMTEPPKTATYASVVSRESVRIALTIAALNDLEVKSADIQNAYLTAPCQEKIVIRVGDEFGEDSGKLAVIVRALYGLASSGAAFRNHLADCMRTLGYTSCLADRDVWLKPMVRPEDGFQYYAYVLLYVDDVLCVHHDAEGELLKIDRFFKMKPGSINDPDLYLGAKVCKMTMINGVQCWGFSPSKYVREAVSNADTYHKKRYGQGLPKKVKTPYERDYRPELDTTPELNASDASYYHSAIGILRWIVELGRVDIITEVSLLSSHLALPREGHLETVFRVFAYLGNKHNSVMLFDPSYPDINRSDFKDYDWKEFYGNVKEPIPPNAPEPRGKDVDLRLFVDSDHGGNKLNRRSRTGYFIYINMAPIAWQSKKQAMVESSVFGAEFCAMKIGIETCRGLRYKLRMMGIPLSGPTYVYGDNQSVIHNTSKPESTLKKKSNSIAYHACRESVAMGESLTTHISTHLNPADLATKVLPGGIKRDRTIDLVLFYLGNSEDVQAKSA